MAAFSGQLNANEIYSAIYNQIISQRIFDIDVAEPTLANRLRTDGTSYGDTKLFYSADILGSAAWGNDKEAATLMNLKRNEKIQTQPVTIDQFRQCMITVDEYLSKRAWIREGSFSQFNGILVGSLTQTKKVFDNGLINTFVGTRVSTAARANQTVSISDLPAVTTVADVEASARIKGQRVSKLIADIFVELKDNRRDYNEFGFIRAYRPDELLMVWNAQQKNAITHLDLPTIFNKGDLRPMDGIDIDQRYFGTEGTTALAAANGTTHRSLVEADFGTAPNLVHVFPGDLIPAGQAAAAKTYYTQDSTVIGKLISVEGVPFMSGFEVGTSFFNPKSLTTNHYLTWGYNTLVALSEKPFVTIKMSS